MEGSDEEKNEKKANNWLTGEEGEYISLDTIIERSKEQKREDI